MMGKFLAITTALCSSLLIFGCSSGGGGNGGGQTTEVWIGNYSGSAPTSGDAPTGKICLKLTQNGAQVTGSAWVAGWLWKADFSGTLTNNTQLSGSASGQDLEGNNITVNYDLTISGNTITGSITVNGATTYNFSVNLQKDPNKTDCGWASRELANAFADALGSASSNPDLGTALASFITEVPRVDVKIDGTTYQQWWACIWEVRKKDSSGNPTMEYTIGGIIDDQSFQKAIGWYIEDDNLSDTNYYIGLDKNFNIRNVNVSNLGNSTPKGAVFINYSNPLNSSFTANGGVEDVYKTSGTSLPANSDPIMVTECHPSTNTQYKVWMTFLTDFCIKFDTTTPTNRSASAPPNACTETVSIPALYIEEVACTP